MHAAPPTDTGAAAVEQAAATWLARRDGDAWTPADADALEAWLSGDAAHRVAFLRLDAAWRATGRLQALAAGRSGSGVPPRGAFARHAATSAPTSSPVDGPDLGALVFARRPVDRRARWPGRALAAVVTVCAIAGGWSWYRQVPLEAVDYATTLGAVRTVALSDGSATTLGSDTRIDVRLSRAQRTIALDRGEAYFEAAKDRARPFVVEAGARRVVAVGTRFSVRRDDGGLRVVVTEGIVRLESVDGDAAPAVLLPAGSVAVARPGGVLVRQLPLADAARLVDWRSGLLVFSDTPLSEVAAEFNRYNARKIEIADAGVGALRIGGSFRWENSEAFVRLLEQGFPVRAEYGDARIVLRPL